MEVVASPKFGLGQTVWREGCEYRVNCQHVFANGTVDYDIVRGDGNTWLYVRESDLSATPPDPYQGWTLEECRQEVRKRGRSLTVGELCDTAVAWPRGAYDELRGSGNTYDEAARALLRAMDKEGAK